MNIALYDYTMVVLIGAARSGKTAFAEKHFRHGDICGGDVPDFSRTVQVMDGNWLEGEKRRDLLRLAKNENWTRVGIIFDLDEETLLSRKDAALRKNMLLADIRTVENLSKKLNQEGFDQLYFLKSEAEVNDVTFSFEKGVWDHREECGPFDIIGDVHGCLSELTRLVRKLGYAQDEDGTYFHPEHRKIVFAGDVTDRGEDSTGTLRLIMKLCRDHCAYMVMGNHDDRLRRYLMGKPVETVHGLETTAAEFEKESPEFREQVISFLEQLPFYLMFDEGRLAVVHAGIREKDLRHYTKKIRQYCLYGESTGEINEIGVPVRLDWAQDYTGGIVIVYGHTPHTAVVKVNNTYCVDTGCVYGYRLSALRYPEMKAEWVKFRRKKKEKKNG